MRYNVHPPRAFRNRIARNLGVLVAAALSRPWGCRVPRRRRRRIAGNRGNGADRRGKWRCIVSPMRMTSTCRAP